MLKYIYRVIILLSVFVASLFYFSRDIKEVVYKIDNTTSMENATFPLVTIKAGDYKINLLHGYSSNLDANKIRETVTPINTDRSFEVLIDHKGMNIKKLNYEIRDFVSNALIETDSVSVFEDKGEFQSAKIKLKAELAKDKEYAVKITLITDKSDKMYYYQRIKQNEEVYLKQKLDFIMNFHQTILDKETAENIVSFLEPSTTADNSSLAYVNINSSFDLVSWGSLQPIVLTEIIPDIKEIYTDTASVELNYVVEATVNGVMEKYRVTEFYRVRYSPDRMYLLNYERKMESIFDISLANISKNQLRLGITTDYKVPFKASADETKLAFIRNRELWFYDLANNQITKVFSFRQEKTDYLRDMYDQHDIRILSMDAEGNLDFLVYGYMNRGQYEGRVAMILYRYIESEARIEEMVYIPIDEPFQSLKENISELTYVNSMEVFYFHVYNHIYSYNLITRELTQIASGVNENMVVVLPDLNYAAWQENTDPRQSVNINIMDLETGKQETISSEAGYNIRLMDMIDTNIIYGLVNAGDIAQMMDGSIMAPLSVVNIASVDKNILKTYQDPEFYVSGLEVKENIVELSRVQKVKEEGRTAYVLATQDFIMNQVKKKNPVVNVVSEETDQELTEYYLTLPKAFDLEEIPKVTTTVNTVISEDPTVRLPESEQALLYYYPYITGGIEGAYETAAEAIKIAKENIGVVLDSNHQLIWERGVKAPSHIISDFEDLTWEDASDQSIEGCIQLMLKYQKVAVSKDKLKLNSRSAYEVIKEFSKYPPIRLTGITLDDALYYVSEDRPLIAMTSLGSAVIIYGYDAFNIMVIDPTDNKVSKIGIQDSTKMFEDAGNVFLSYLEQ